MLGIWIARLLQVFIFALFARLILDYYKTGQEILTKYYEKYNPLKIKPVVIEKMFKFELNGGPVS